VPRARVTAIPVLACAVTAAFAIGCNFVLGLGDVPIPADAASTSDGTIAPSADAGVDASAHDGSLAEGGTATTGDATTPEGGTACNSQNTQNDPASCGRCGHSCLGGGCSLGACQPFALVSVDSGAAPSSLAQDDSYLYWTDAFAQGTIHRVDKLSGTDSVLVTQSDFPSAIAVDDIALYFGDSNGLWRSSKTSAATPTLVASVAEGAPTGLAIDDAGLYWAEGTGYVYAAHKLGSNETGSPIWEGDAETAEVASDGQRVYFTADDGLLHVVSVDGGASLSLGSPDPAGSFGIALSAGDVFWTVYDPTNGEVLAASTTALATQPIAVEQQQPAAVASDGVIVYWANTRDFESGTSEICSCVLGDCSTVTVVGQGFSDPTAIVVDSTAIYGIDRQPTLGSNGAVWEIAR